MTQVLSLTPHWRASCGTLRSKSSPLLGTYSCKLYPPWVSNASSLTRNIQRPDYFHSIAGSDNSLARPHLRRVSPSRPPLFRTSPSSALSPAWSRACAPASPRPSSRTTPPTSSPRISASLHGGTPRSRSSSPSCGTTSRVPMRASSSRMRIHTLRRWARTRRYGT